MTLSTDHDDLVFYNLDWNEDAPDLATAALTPGTQDYCLDHNIDVATLLASFNDPSTTVASKKGNRDDQRLYLVTTACHDVMIDAETGMILSIRTNKSPQRSQSTQRPAAQHSKPAQRPVARRPQLTQRSTYISGDYTTLIIAPSTVAYLDRRDAKDGREMGSSVRRARKVIATLGNTAQFIEASSTSGQTLLMTPTDTVTIDRQRGQLVDITTHDTVRNMTPQRPLPRTISSDPPVSQSRTRGIPRNGTELMEVLAQAGFESSTRHNGIRVLVTHPDKPGVNKTLLINKHITGTKARSHIKTLRKAFGIDPLTYRL